MRFRNTAILAVLVALLGAYLYLVERPAYQREQEKRTLLSFDPDEAVKIALETSGEKIEIEKREGKWVITAPRELPADQTAVQNLLRATAEAELKREVAENPKDWAPFGLDEPVARVQVELEGGRALPSLAVGKATPIGFNAYARRDDEAQVLLTTGAFRSGVQKKLDDLRDRKILDFEEDDVSEIALRPREGAAVRIHRDAAGWKIVEPIEAKADAARVRSLLGSLRTMRVRRFVEGDEGGDAAARGLEPPRLRVELSLEGGESRVLEVGGATPEASERQIYVRVPDRDAVYTVGSHVWTSLSKNANDLRDKTVLAVDRKAVSRLAVERKDGEDFVLERQGDEWHVADAGAAATRKTVAQRLVDDVLELHGTSVATDTGDFESFGLDEPSIRITLSSEEGELGQILLAARGEDHYAAARGAELVFEIPDYVFRRFDKRRSDLLEEPEPTASPEATASPEPHAKATASPPARSSARDA